MARSIERMFYHPISRFSVFIAGIYSFMWGLWVATPAWDAFPTSEIYEYLAWSGSEITWGSIQMLVGICLLIAAFDSRKAMKWASFAGFVSWFLVAFSFIIADWQNAGMWVTGYIAANHAYFYLNLKAQED